MMKNNYKITLLLLITAVAFTGIAHGQTFIGNASPGAGDSGVFEYWNFNTFDPAVDTSLASDFGSGTIDLTSWSGSVGNFGGNSANAQMGDVAGDSLSLVDQLGNGSFIEISFSMSNLESLDIEYWNRKTGTGFNNNAWSYSTDGTNFTSFASGLDPINDTGGELGSITNGAAITTTALDGASSAFLRYELDGATSASGNNRIDNLTLTATAVPEPGHYAALLGLFSLGFIYWQRRRAH